MEKIFMTFICYGVIGWLWESFYCSLKAKHFVYRGFLLGPYCPVYGFAITAVLLLVPAQINNFWLLYVKIVVVITVIEFITSWLLEKLFNMKLWDYTNVPLNLKGRVALPVSLLWGIGGIFLITTINPLIQHDITRFNNFTHHLGALFIFVLFTADLLSTLYFTATTKKAVASAIDNTDTENANVKEYRLKHLFSNHSSSRNRKHVLKFIKSQPPTIALRHLHRLIKNYPNLTFKK